MHPIDLSFLPFLPSKSAARKDGGAAMAHLHLQLHDAEAYDAAVSEGWSVSQHARHCPAAEA